MPCSSHDCDRPIYAKGLCGKHYARFRTHGTTADRIGSHAPAEERFMRRVDKTETCWVWTGKTERNGYGRFQPGGKGTPLVGAHRFSFQAFVGPIPEGQFVMHRCDNRRCVRPDHLETGPPVENTADMIRKERHARKAPRGAANGRSKLDASTVKMIRQSPKNNAALARQLGLSVSTVRGVRTGRTWSHLS